MRIYTSLKQAVIAMIRKHFPPEIAKRFSIRMDSEIWIPGMDEGIWRREKHDIESIHVMFDNTEIFEIPRNLSPRYAEVYFLRAFKQALEDGLVSIEKVREFSTPEQARRNKREKQKQKKKDLEDSFEYALQTGDREVKRRKKRIKAGKTKDIDTLDIERG